MNPSRPLLGPLGRRLTAAFIVVAFTAIAVVALLTMASARSEVSGLTDAARRDDVNAVAVAVAEAYQGASGWVGIDLSAAAAIAARGQATLTVLDRGGQVIAAPTDALASMMVQMHGLAMVDTPRGDPVTAEVVVNAVTVGEVQLRFPVGSMAEEHVREALERSAVLAVLLATALAVIVAVSVSIRVSRPVNALIAAAGDLASGRRHTRVAVDGPGELRRLAEAFNNMADSLDREDELRRNLVADVAHELRTPLAVLQGSTEALLDGIDRPDVPTLASLHDEVIRLRRLVGDLESLAAAEAAGLHLRADRVDLSDVAATAVDLLGPFAAERRVTLATDLLVARTAGDADRLLQVAVNLVANAVKFSPTDTCVTVRTATVGGNAVLEVSDQGAGIRPGDVAHIFERFWRGSEATGTTGNGVGLAIVKELVTAHRGTVSVTNNPERGARFTVQLPSST